MKKILKKNFFKALLSIIMKKSSVKCINCGKKTGLLCSECQKPICSRHAYTLKKSWYCLECFTIYRKKGLIKAWSTVGIMGVIAIIIWVLLI